MCLRRESTVILKCVDLLYAECGIFVDKRSFNNRRFWRKCDWSFLSYYHDSTSVWGDNNVLAFCAIRGFLGRAWKRPPLFSFPAAESRSYFEIPFLCFILILSSRKHLHFQVFHHPSEISTKILFSSSLPRVLHSHSLSTYHTAYRRLKTISEAWSGSCRGLFVASLCVTWRY
jgi:hypothetical protein